MPLRLLIDEDTQAKQLVLLMRQAQHDVLTVGEAELTDKNDPEVLAFARQERRIVLTRNCSDFQALHLQNTEHPGIIGIFQYNNPAKDMSYVAIVQAIANLEASGWNLVGHFVVLNQWHFPAPPTAPTP